MGTSDPSTLTLTVNARLARWLQLQHHNAMAETGQTAWESPNIHFIDSWIRETWLDSWPEKFILSELQSLVLWENIIRQDHETHNLDLLHIRGAAKKAQEAFKLIHNYAVQENPDVFNVWNRETSSYFRWSRAYRKQLARWSALDASEILATVHQLMKSGCIPIPPRISFSGFEEIHPGLQLWIDFLKSRGTEVGFLSTEPGKPVDLDQALQIKTPTVRRYQSREEEVTQCARWVRTVYGKDKTIGIVVTQMEEYRDLLYRELSWELCPDNVFPWQRKEAPFNFSLGTPLTCEPMVHEALKILSIDGDWIPLSIYSLLLTSNYFNNSNNEDLARVQHDWRLRRDNRTHISLSQELKTAEEEGRDEFHNILDHLNQRIRNSKNILPSEWTHQTAALLHQMGWPARYRTLTSTEYQVGDALNDCFDELATLDTVLSPIDPRQALSHFTRIVENKDFQIKTSEKPIQVVGLLESTGMEFDHLWIMGCHAEVLPNLHTANPYIPYPVQREHQLPYSTPQRTLQFYERILIRLLEASPQCEISYPAQDDQTELMISPLLRQAEPSGITPLINTSNRLIDRFPTSTIPESYSDKESVPFLKEEFEKVNGNSSLFQQQAQCPFRAFAEKRLHAESRPLPDFDFDHPERGTVVHETLKFFWRKIKTRSDLQDLIDSETLDRTLEPCIIKAIEKFKETTYRQNHFFELERERLLALIREWLLIESKRSDFSVEETELEEQAEINGLPVNIRLDRIDRVGKDQRLLIDYKTGKSKTAKWYQEPLQEPQLPLYQFCTEADAIAFAGIKKGELQFRFISETDTLFDKKYFSPPTQDPLKGKTWKEIKKFWETQIHNLAAEFQKGYAKVAPYNLSETCRYCQLETLCRKNELLPSLVWSEWEDDS